MSAVHLEVVTGHYRRALPFNSTMRTPLRYFQPTAVEPGTGVVDPEITTNTAVTDGVVTLENPQTQYLRIMPTCEGPAWTWFWLRLWGWQKINEANPIWVPTLIVQLACYSGSITGVPAAKPDRGDISTYAVTDREKFCYGIWPITGSLGYGGGVWGGRASAAFAKVDVAGSKKVQFDFEQRAFDHIGMNAYWAHAS